MICQRRNTMPSSYYTPAPGLASSVDHNNMERAVLGGGGDHSSLHASERRVHSSKIMAGFAAGADGPSVVHRRANDIGVTTHRQSSSTELKAACHDELIHMSLDGTQCSLGGLNSMKVNSTSTYTNGWEISGQIDSIRGKACLRDAAGEVLAVVIRQPSCYEVLCPTPAYAGQTAHKIVSKSKVLYKWATIKQDKLFSSTYTIRNEATNAVYTTKECGPWFRARSVRITDVKTGEPCALIRQKFDNGAVSKPIWDVLVGTDRGCPKVIICFLAVINKCMAKF